MKFACNSLPQFSDCFSVASFKTVHKLHNNSFSSIIGRVKSRIVTEFIQAVHRNMGVRGGAVGYKLEVRGFDSRWGHWDIFHRRNPTGCTMTLGSTQPLKEMNTRDIFWG